MDDGSGTGIRIELYIRGCTASEARVEAIIRRVETLERSGSIESAKIRTWPGRVSLLRGGASSDVRDAFDRFRTWAREKGARIEPPFSVTEHRSSITGERDIVLYTPVICLAAYEGDRLVDVVPRAENGSIVTIDSFLDARPDVRESEADPSREPPNAADLVAR